MLSGEEFQKKCELYRILLINPLKAIEEIGRIREIDFVQIALVTILGIAIGLITSGVGGLGNVISIPLSIFIGGAILLLFTLIAGGKIDYIGMVNFSAYLAIFTVLASLFHRVPFIGQGVGLLASLYSIYLIYIGLPLLVEARSEVMKVIAIIFIILVAFGFVLSFVWRLGFIFLNFIF
ncbi:hypothetical protein CS063_12760 [Sporanaerobium hydrogeniformans]|uniref:Uncharacterized protein n=1 Tax=Sporanaerobium hydrogeniformans TaxID=3072179 RepID=A0AC61DBI1_9FIRM|nr:Yip1 family protein [Sporanaerobium hydrogeniformans]PHV70011.1 hypothetical protein CS063_12760 [Sporanaerobium hydrogeniformans]